MAPQIKLVILIDIKVDDGSIIQIGKKKNLELNSQII